MPNSCRISFNKAAIRMPVCGDGNSRQAMAKLSLFFEAGLKKWTVMPKQLALQARVVQMSAVAWTSEAPAAFFTITGFMPGHLEFTYFLIVFLVGSLYCGSAISSTFRNAGLSTREVGTKVEITISQTASVNFSCFGCPCL